MRRSPRPLLSWLFLLLSVGLFAAGAILYVQGREGDEGPVIPAATPGQNELIHLLTALEAEDLDVEALSGSEGVSSRMLEGVGQPLTIDGERAYVFIYQDEAEQEAVTLDVLADDVDLMSNPGEPLAVTNPRLFTGSNVALILVDGDEELAERVTAAMARLA